MELTCSLDILIWRRGHGMTMTTPLSPAHDDVDVVLD